MHLSRHAREFSNSQPKSYAYNVLLIKHQVVFSDNTFHDVRNGAGAVARPSDTQCRVKYELVQIIPLGGD